MKKPLLCTWKGWSESTSGMMDLIAASDPNRPYPFKALLGWKGLVVWDPDIDPVDLLRAYLTKVAQESCGQCTPCREGTPRLAQIMEHLCNGQGRPGDLDEIRVLATFISETARCDVGRCLAHPIMEIMTRYADAFDAVIKENRTVAPQRYEAAVTAPCMSACPSNVDIPAYIEGIRIFKLLRGIRNDLLSKKNSFYFSRNNFFSNHYSFFS